MSLPLKATPEDAVSAGVCSLLRGLCSKEQAVERRSRRRYAYPHLVRLVPIDDDGQALEEDAVVVVGRHLSEQGLGFYHPQPLAHRRMIATLDKVDGSPLSLLIDVHWCRFTGGGWYESGGRFLAVVEA